MQVHGNAEIEVMVLPYKSFKERIRLVREYEGDYKIEVMDGCLYLRRRNKEN